LRLSKLTIPPERSAAAIDISVDGNSFELTCMIALPVHRTRSTVPVGASADASPWIHVTNSLSGCRRA
jgi:hypothetical protein